MERSVANTTSFEDIRSIVEQEHPLPLPTSFRRVRIQDRRDLGGRHKGTIDLFEVLIRFLAIAVLQEARSSIPDLTRRLPNGEKTLEFLRRPSLGGWLGLLRMLLKVTKESDGLPVTTAIRGWFFAPTDSRLAQALESISATTPVDQIRRAKHPIAEICNQFVTYRNKSLAHAANLTDEALESRLPLLEAAISVLLSRAEFLTRLRLLHIGRVEVSPGGKMDGALVLGVPLARLPQGHAVERAPAQAGAASPHSPFFLGGRF